MENFPILKSTRITLSQPKVTDIPTIIKYAGHTEIEAGTLSMPHPYQEKDAIFWLNFANEGVQNKNRYIFGIRLNETDEFIGGMGLHIEGHFNRAELGYWIGVPFWNKGYATEAAKTILKFGFEDLKLNKIFAMHFKENPSSGKVLSKSGMVKEGEFKEYIKKGENYIDVTQYGLTKGEYELIKTK